MDEHPVIDLVRSKVPDPGRPFTLIADLTAIPGRGGEVAAAVAGSGAVGLTRVEPGCLWYDISQDLDAPDRFVAYERWRDVAALQSHLATAHFAAVGAALRGLLAGAPIVRVLTPVVPDAEPGGPADIRPGFYWAAWIAMVCVSIAGIAMGAWQDGHPDIASSCAVILFLMMGGLYCRRMLVGAAK